MLKSAHYMLPRWYFAVLALGRTGLPGAWGVPGVVRGTGAAGGQHDAELFSLAGQAGLPKYLKCNQQCLAGPDGVHGGEVRTLDTDYFKKDFTLDVVFQFKGDDDRGVGFVGIGEHGQDAAATIVAQLTGPASGGNATLGESHRPRTKKKGRPRPARLGSSRLPARTCCAWKRKGIRSRSLCRIQGHLPARLHESTARSQ